MGIVQRTKQTVVTRILGADDTPHRIAWGVFLGLLIGWTPTFGIQILLYLGAAALFRANKTTGIPLTFIANPLTAVPLYYFAWKVGSLLLHGFVPPAADQREVQDRIAASLSEGFFTNLSTSELWSDLGSFFLDVGAELWVGSLVMGVATGAAGYVLAYYGVRAYRRRSQR